MSDEQQKSLADSLNLPAGLIDKNNLYPTIFIDLKGAEANQPPEAPKINEAIFHALNMIHAGDIRGQALHKVHIGESRCVTRMNPVFMAGGTRFLRHRGIDVVVAGDTTVAYTGPRGHRQNPGDQAEVYSELAVRHGWHRNGAADVPFVVLDRPGTFAPAAYKRGQHQDSVLLEGVQRFKDFFPAEGFTAADFVINHAHLTLHGLAGVAGCIKSIAMGCSALPGKLRMHQSLLPVFDGEQCKNCGLCARHCPEQAIVTSEEENGVPSVATDRCIGCGECVSVCKSGAVTLVGSEIEDWRLGEETLPERMADYALGLMSGRWDRTVHLMHLYSVTELCDCVDVCQKPIVSDIGFLLGKNPFALDRMAGQLLAERIPDAMRGRLGGKLTSAEATAEYVRRHYGIRTDGPVTRLTLTHDATGAAG